MFIYVNKILIRFIMVILTLNILHGGESENIDIHGNIIIPFYSLLDAYKVQKKLYVDDLIEHPYYDKQYYTQFKKIQLLKKSNKISEDDAYKILEYSIEKSIENNSRLNNYLRGVLYFISKEYDKAFPLLKKSSDQGNKDALFLYSLYFTPYIGNRTDIKKFYFLLLQSIVGESNLPLVSQIRWWKSKNIKPLLRSSVLIGIIEKNKLIKEKDIDNLDEYIYRSTDSKHMSKDKRARLTLLFKDIFYSQDRMTSLNEQVISKNMSPSTLFTTFEISNEKECEHTKPFIYTKSYQPENKCGKNIPFEKFIKKISAGDVCLISNKKAHHLLFVYSIDYKKKKIYFIDGWPKKSFLLKTNNLIGLKGKLTTIGQRQLIELPFADFHYVVVGCAKTPF